jgi:hypothetical protein
MPLQADPIDGAQRHHRYISFRYARMLTMGLFRSRSKFEKTEVIISPDDSVLVPDLEIKESPDIESCSGLQISTNASDELVDPCRSIIDIRYDEEVQGEQEESLENSEAHVPTAIASLVLAENDNEGIDNTTSALSMTKDATEENKGNMMASTEMKESGPGVLDQEVWGQVWIIAHCHVDFVLNYFCSYDAQDWTSFFT